MSNSVNKLFDNATDEGVISPAAADILQVDDLGEDIQAALGVSADNFTASEVVLVTMLIDDSGSIRFGSNTQAVRDGHNQVIAELVKAKQQDSILIHTRYLNGDVLYPYCPLDQAIKMDQNNFNPVGGTPLYKQAIVVAGTILAKSQEFRDNGVPVRTITLIISDGGDNDSDQYRAKDVAKIVTDMLKQENHIVAALGVDDGSTDFQQVFSDMGVDAKWIFTIASKPEEIRRAFQLFSRSAIRASQNAASFSKTAIGGFGN